MELWYWYFRNVIVVGAVVQVCMQKEVDNFVLRRLSYDIISLKLYSYIHHVMYLITLTLQVFFDWGMLWLLASHYPHPVPPMGHVIIIPSCCASIPYLIRARQCLIMHNVGKHKNDPARYQHVLNAIKYSTSLFPLIVSVYQKTMAGELVAKQLDKALVILLA